MSSATRQYLLDPFGPRLGHEWAASPNAPRWQVREGTLGFFDVSGYTRLTERLARLGADGAEAITDIANALFVGLISAALSYGGDVLQFSGDAILVYFDGADHAARACLAASGMQRFIRDHGAITTDIGRVRLRMSVGLHSGPIMFALLGHDQLAVLALGEHASAALAAEKEANAGEVLLTGSTAARVDPGWVRSSREGMFRLGPVHSVDPGLPDREHLRPDVAPAIASAFVPLPLRALLAERGLPGEHRQLSLAFIGTRGLDELLLRSGPDELTARLQALTRSLEHVQAEYGLAWTGTDALPGGADFLLVAGTPVGHEDDEDRILLACRELLAEDFGLHLAVGVNRGRNFTGDVGHPWRRTYSISGDATNLAARIMARAESDQLLVHAPLMDRVRGVPTAREQEPFVAKGKRLPVRTVQLDDLRPGGDHTSQALPELLGRTDEVDTLRSVLSRALTGEGAAVEIVGPAGLGKSRLLQTLRQLGDGTRWMQVGGEPYARTRALLPVRRLLRSLIGVADDADAVVVVHALEREVRDRAPELRAWLPLLATVVGVTMAPSPETARLHPDYVAERRDAVTSAFILAFATAPLVLAFEDLHWFDDASLSIVTHLARATAGSCLLVVGTRRPEGGALADVEALVTVELDPLDDRSSTRVLLEAAGSVTLPEHLLRDLVARAAGNPMFLRELAASAAHGNSVTVPERIERVVAARIDALDHRDRIQLREASVAGHHVELSFLARALGAAELADPRSWRGTDGLAEVRDGTLHFRHDLVRAAAYEGLAHVRRRAVHAQLAETLADGVRSPDTAAELAPLLALHWSEAHAWGDAWTWGLRAVETATDRAAPVEAYALARRTLAAARRLPDLGEVAVGSLYETAGDLANRIGLLDDAHQAYGRARAHLRQSALAEARLARKRGDVAEKEGRYPQSLRWHRRGLTLVAGVLESREQREIYVDLRLSYAGTLHQQARNAASRALTLEVLPDAERLGGAVLAQAYLQLATTTAFLDSHDGEPYASRATEIIGSLGDDLRLACLHLNLGVAAVDANDFSAGLARYPQAEAAFARCGDAVGAALALHNRGELLGLLGCAGAVQCFTDALRQFRACGYRVGELIALSGLGRAAAFDGDVSVALEHLTTARSGFVAIGHRAFEIDTDLRLAELQLLTGDVDAADTMLASAGPRIDGLERRGFFPVWHDRLHAVILARRGDLESASTLLGSTIDRAAAGGFEIEVATALDTQIRLAVARGGDPSRLEARRDEISRRLGVERLLTL